MKAKRPVNPCQRVQTLVVSGFISVTVLLWGCPEAAATGTDSRTRTSTSTIHREAAVAEIRSLLDAKLGRAGVSTKVQDKLRTLDDRQLHLMASLADRITAEANTPGTDLALLLLTALVVLL